MKISKMPLISALLLVALPLWAEDILVSDCIGTLRASSVIESGSSSQVVITLSSPTGQLPSVVNVSMADSGNGDSRKAKAVDGKVFFRDIPAGQWKICPVEESFGIENVSIVSSGTSGFHASEVVLGGVGATGLAGAVGLSLGGGSSESDSTLLSGSPGGSIPAKPAGEASQLEVAAAVSSQEEDRREACLTGEKPTPLSPFL